MIRAMAAIQVPTDRLNQATLERLVGEFVTRDGTDYGEKERTLEQKKAAVLSQLERGDVVIMFDPEDETVHIVTKAELQAAKAL